MIGIEYEFLCMSDGVQHKHFYLVHMVCCMSMWMWMQACALCQK